VLLFVAQPVQTFADEDTGRTGLGAFLAVDGGTDCRTHYTFDYGVGDLIAVIGSAYLVYHFACHGTGSASQSTFLTMDGGTNCRTHYTVYNRIGDGVAALTVLISGIDWSVDGLTATVYLSVVMLLGDTSHSLVVFTGGHHQLIAVSISGVDYHQSVIVDVKVGADAFSIIATSFIDDFIESAGRHIVGVLSQEISNLLRLSVVEQFSQGSAFSGERILLGLKTLLVSFA